MRKIAKKHDQIVLRRNLVAELYSKGFSDQEITDKLECSRTTISTDLKILRQTAKLNMKMFSANQLPFEYKTIFLGLRNIIKRLWEITNDPNTEPKVVSSNLSILLEAYDHYHNLVFDSVNVSSIEGFVNDDEQRQQGPYSHLHPEQDKQHPEALFHDTQGPHYRSSSISPSDAIVS
jgi:IS30 family transposase